MDASSIDERFNFGRDLIQETGDPALDYFRRLDTLRVHRKGPQDMASEADTSNRTLTPGIVWARWQLLRPPAGK
jgi:hypothetical protein